MVEGIKEKRKKIQDYFFGNKIIYASATEDYTWDFLMDAIDILEGKGYVVIIILKNCKIGEICERCSEFSCNIDVTENTTKEAVFVALNDFVIWELLINKRHGK